MATGSVPSSSSAIRTACISERVMLFRHHSPQAALRAPCSLPATRVALNSSTKHQKPRGRRCGRNLVMCSAQFERDEDFVEAHVTDAVRLTPKGAGLYMSQASGADVEVTHVNPMAGRLLYSSSVPTIFLKLADGSGHLLPVVVGDSAVLHLMKGFRCEQGVRPDCYDLLGNVVDALHYNVKVVRITQRVGDTYHATVYMSKPSAPNDIITVDARPSDAINVAVRAQVPIFVHKSISAADAVQVVLNVAGTGNGGVADAHGSTLGGAAVLAAVPAAAAARGSVLVLSKLGSINAHEGLQTDTVSREATLVTALSRAVIEERYTDAVKLRDALGLFRGSKRRVKS